MVPQNFQPDQFMGLGLAQSLDAGFLRLFFHMHALYAKSNPYSGHSDGNDERTNAGLVMAQRVVKQ